MPREIVEPMRDEEGRETHPAWALVGAYRVSNSPPGATLFDSDIRHTHTVIVRLSTASRRRDLSHDWHHGEREFVEIEMSEAQWASFVSSMNSGSGVPCTIRRREDDVLVPGMPFAPRLQESMDEVRGAADAAVAKVQAAFAAYEAKKNAANLRTLKFAIQNMPANMAFAAKSLTEHAEGVVQKARVDIEAMVVAKAEQLGLEPGDVIGEQALLGGGEPEEDGRGT